MVGCYTPDDPRFLPRVLAAADYRTASIGKVHLIPQAEEIKRLPRAANRAESFDYYGFGDIDLVNGHGMNTNGPDYTAWLSARVPDFRERRAAARPISPGVNNATGSLRTHTWELPAEVHSGEYVAARTCAFLERAAADQRDRPFFVHASFPEPHHPFTVPEPYASMYRPARMPLPVAPVTEPENAPTQQVRVYRGEFDKDRPIGTPPDTYARYGHANLKSLLPAQLLEQVVCARPRPPTGAGSRRSPRYPSGCPDYRPGEDIAGSRGRVSLRLSEGVVDGLD